MSRIEQVQSLISELEPDMEKFYEKGNKAAGTRARKTLQEIKKVSQEIRVEIQEWKNSGKVDNL
jgi:Tfp pilus assembly protein PilE